MKPEDKKMEGLEETLKTISEGTEKSLVEIKATNDSVTELNEKVVSMDALISEADEKRAKSDGELAKLVESMNGQSEKITGLRKLLNHNLGESGADDWLHIFGKWMAGVMHQKRDGVVPDQFKVDGYDFETRGQKANATTQVDANAGWLIPDILFPELMKAEDIYGNLLPLIRQVTMPCGGTMKVNQQATMASVSWRCAECTEIPETSLLLDQLELKPCLLGGIVPASQELVNYPGVNFFEIVAENMIQSIVEKKEMAILQADHTAGGAAAPPSDGVLVDSNVHDITAGLPHAPTLKDYLAFIGAAVANYPALMRTGLLILPLARHFELISLMVDKSCSSPAWAAMAPGSPSSPLGWPAISHPGMTIGAVDWAAFLNPKDILGAGNGTVSVDINPYGAGWTSNCLSIKVYTCFDWILLNAKGMSKGDYAAS